MSVADHFEAMDYGPAPEASDFVLDWLAERRDRFGFFINSAFTRPTDVQTLPSINPATEEWLADIPIGDAAVIDQAVAAAKKAQPGWAKLSGHERARFLYALARLIQKNARALAVLETLDNGKPIRESRDIDVPLVVRHFYHHAGWAQLMARELPDREPLGVVGQIIPWNFPLLMLAWKVAPALAMGNTVVWKPAEFTSLTALFFAELCVEAGLPKGVVNIVTGAGETGALLVDHPDVAKIAFTGSTEVGRLIRERTAGTGKVLTLELGGKSPFIVLNDADLDAAVEGLVDAIWFNQGEVCCAGSRLLVEASIATDLVEKVKRRLETFRIGDPLDKSVDMGAVVDPSQLKTIDGLVEQGRSEGAEIWQPDVALPGKGSFFKPTLVLGAEPADTLMQCEIFGPVLTVTTFRTEAEAIALANNTRYGLAASIWSETANRALDLAAKVKAGVVWINSTNQFDAAAGFGGYRESGFGREGAKVGLYAYTREKDGWLDRPATIAPPTARETVAPSDHIDRTAKLYIGGKQARPDGGRTSPVLSYKGTLIDRVGEGNRKDIRNGVEAAVKAEAWSRLSGHARAQILYYLAENLEPRAGEFAARLRDLTGATTAAAKREVSLSLSRLFTWGAWADKYDGAVHGTPFQGMTFSTHEPLGVLGVVCPDQRPLLSLISLLAPAIAMGNRVVLVPSERYPLVATDFYQVLETSDVPAGVVNIVTGERDLLAGVLADHDGVDGLWYHGSQDGSRSVEAKSVTNLKQTWVNQGRDRDWLGSAGERAIFLHKATQVKTTWLPYGV